MNSIEQRVRGRGREEKGRTFRPLGFLRSVEEAQWAERCLPFSSPPHPLLCTINGLDECHLRSQVQYLQITALLLHSLIPVIVSLTGWSFAKCSQRLARRSGEPSPDLPRLGVFHNQSCLDTAPPGQRDRVPLVRWGRLVSFRWPMQCASVGGLSSGERTTWKQLWQCITPLFVLFLSLVL